MPELPEVETTRRGLVPHLKQQSVINMTVREGRLRWPVPSDLPKTLIHQPLRAIERRAKYLLFRFDEGTLIAHLGMSGSMRLVSPTLAPLKHDHIDIAFANGQVLRYNDPRRFGAMLWTTEAPADHPLLAKLGPEPLSDAFSADYLVSKAQRRKVNLKQLIMDQHVVVGVGNIYATEALFMAGLDPRRAANTLKPKPALQLVDAIQMILADAIQQGGTTLRDFVNSDGKPGYFKQSLRVYGRATKPCLICKHPLSHCQINQRATVFCEQCQK